MKKHVIFWILSLAISLQAIDVPIGVWDPTKDSPFVMNDKEFSETFKNYRSTWKRVTGFEYSGLHWNQGVTIYINKNADVYWKNYKSYIDQREEEDLTVKFVFLKYPVGTILMKENFNLGRDQDKRPVSAQTATVMIKREKGYDADGGDWQYIRYDTRGRIMINGNSQDPAVRRTCYDCHKNISERDYVFSTFYKNPVGQK